MPAELVGGTNGGGAVAGDAVGGDGADCSAGGGAGDGVAVQQTGVVGMQQLGGGG